MVRYALTGTLRAACDLKISCPSGPAANGLEVPVEFGPLRKEEGVLCSYALSTTKVHNPVSYLVSRVTSGRKYFRFSKKALASFRAGAQAMRGSRWEALPRAISVVVRVWRQPLAALLPVQPVRLSPLPNQRRAADARPRRRRVGTTGIPYNEFFRLGRMRRRASAPQTRKRRRDTSHSAIGLRVFGRVRL